MGDRLGRMTFEVIKDSRLELSIKHNVDLNDRLALMFSSASARELAELEQHRQLAAKHAGIYFSLLDNPSQGGLVRGAEAVPPKPPGIIKA